MKRLFAICLCLFALTSFSLAQPPKAPSKKSMPPVPDKAYMQKIWDGWSTLNPVNVAQYYAPGPHTYFDIAPLKYGSWEEYAKGVKDVLAGYKSASAR